MAEFRQDPILGQWVIVHTENSWGPEEYGKDDNSPKHQATCQFCPGREHMTTPEIEALRHNGSEPNSSDWQIRVIPNKFPALKIEGTLDERDLGIYNMTNGIGAHEVLIETRDHNKGLADLDDEQMLNVIKKYQSRLIDLAKDKRFKYVIIFKNYGESAGTSVEHAHSQIIALPMVPKHVLSELEGTQEYFDEYKRCIFCDILKQEMDDEKRVIAQNNDFVAVCPFVPRYPFECWILPKKHSSNFVSIAEHEQFTLAQLLRDTLKRIKACLSDPSYNYYLHVSPVNYKGEESFHWHIEIVPKLTLFSGFEWGTGFYVVHTAPEDAAGYLREASFK